MCIGLHIFYPCPDIMHVFLFLTTHLIECMQLRVLFDHSFMGTNKLLFTFVVRSLIVDDWRSTAENCGLIIDSRTVVLNYSLSSLSLIADCCWAVIDYWSWIDQRQVIVDCNLLTICLLSISFVSICYWVLVPEHSLLMIDTRMIVTVHWLSSTCSLTIGCVSSVIDHRLLIRLAMAAHCSFIIGRYNQVAS